MANKAPPTRALTLVRGSHIVLPMPTPSQPDAYTLQDEEERVVFVMPWLDQRFLIVGTTDVPHEGSPGETLLPPKSRPISSPPTTVNSRTSARPGRGRRYGATWSGVRAL